jgi:hypothetical protein
MPSPHALEPVFGGSISALDVENEIKRNGCLQQIISLASDSKLGKPLSKTEKAKLEKLIALLAQEMLETRLFTRGWELAARNAEQGYSARTATFQTGKRPRPEEDGNTVQKRAKPQTLTQTTRQVGITRLQHLFLNDSTIALLTPSLKFELELLSGSNTRIDFMILQCAPKHSPWPRYRRGVRTKRQLVVVGP